MRSLGEGAGPGNRCASLVEKDIVAQRSLKIRVVEGFLRLKRCLERIHRRCREIHCYRTW